jgi:hypothetical protein
MSTPDSSGCDACNKSSLSLLLLRPSPIAIDPQLAPLGSSSIKVDEQGLVAGLVPAESLTQSRYALRLLRPGYVHVYIPAPPSGMNNWLVFKVTDNADLIEDTSPVFQQQPAPPSCSREGHNASGMRLLRIPHAHKIKEIWIAYSANLWNTALRQQHQMRPERVMQKIDLRSGLPTPGVFVPTAAALKSRVLECALPQLSINGATDHDFPFVSLQSQVEDLSRQLSDAARCHPDTEGKELAVVLRDPVGLAAELNALRLRRYEQVEQHLLQPHIRQPLEVNKLILTLKNNLMADVDQRSLDAVSPLRYKSAYDASTMPEGTEWRSVSDDERQVLLKSASGDSWLSSTLLSGYKTAFGRHDLGRVVYPDHQARADAWAAAEVNKTWANMTDFYDEAQREKWQEDFEASMQSLHMKPLALYEADWNRALKAPAFFDYFAYHFDADDNNDRLEKVRTGCSAGTEYIKEAALAFTPESYTEAPSKTFEAQLDADITDPDAIMLRAIVGNQKNLFEILIDDKRDRTFDFMKGLLGEYADTKAAAGHTPLPPRLAKTVSWLTNMTLSMSLGLAGVLASTAVSASTRAFSQNGYGDRRGTDPKAPARINRAQGMALIQRASEEMLDAALKERTYSVPVVIKVRCDTKTAVQIMRGRGQPLKRQQVREMHRHGRIELAIFTDSKTLQALQADPGKLRDELTKSAHSVVINEQTHSYKELAAPKTNPSTVLTLPLARFEKLYALHRAQVAQAPTLLKQWMELRISVANSTTVQAGRATLLSMDGRLAIGSMIVQGLGVMAGLREFAVSGHDPVRERDAWLNIANGAACFLGGFFELSTVAWRSRLELTVGGVGANASVVVPALRAAAFGMGVAANILSAWISFNEAEKLREKGYGELAGPMIRSGVIFGIGSIPLFLVAVDFGAKALVKAGVISGTNKIVQQLAKAAAARLGTAAIGLSVPGVGWALTMLAVGETVYVVMNISGPMQHWLSGCYFGTTKWWKIDVPKRDSLEEEQAAFEQAVKEMNESADSPAGGDHA